MSDAPTARRARRAVQYAINRGKLRRQSCEDCGAEKTQAHHADYSKPLEVTWLCTGCHAKRHPMTGEAHPSAKLTQRKVDRIRSLAGTTTQRRLAERFGVSEAQVSKIINRKQWI